jgi:hypothetical protein
MHSTSSPSGSLEIEKIPGLLFASWLPGSGCQVILPTILVSLMSSAALKFQISNPFPPHSNSPLKKLLGVLVVRSTKGEHGLGLKDKKRISSCLECLAANPFSALSLSIFKPFVVT